MAVQGLTEVAVTLSGPACNPMCPACDPVDLACNPAHLRWPYR